METLIFQNSNENIVRISVLKIFKDIIIFKPRGKIMPNTLLSGPPGFKKLSKPLYLVYKNFQDRNPYNIFIAILENQCLHKFTLILSDL